MIKECWNILLGSILFAGCAGQVHSPATPTASTMNVVIPTIETMPELQETSTIGLTVQDFSIQSYCPSIQNEVRDIAELGGTLVFRSNHVLDDEEIPPTDSGLKSTVTFLETQSGKMFSYFLSKGVRYYIFVESPDKEKLALALGKTMAFSTNLLVLDKRGQLISDMDLPENWTIFNWLSEDELLIKPFRTEAQVTKAEENRLFAFNYAKRTSRLLYSDLPNIDLREINWTWGAPTAYRSDGRIVLYDSRVIDSGGQILSRAVLWDIEKKEEIGGLDKTGYWPKWSASGKRLLLVVDPIDETFEDHYELFVIDETGEFSQSTLFRREYEKVWIESPMWSPDERYIAFWIARKTPVKTAELAIHDTMTYTTTVFCQSFNPRPFRFGESTSLGLQDGQVNSNIFVWSPDSRYLLFEDHEDTLMVDTQENSISRLISGAQPVGWLK